MAEHWKSTPRIWCKQCKIFIRDTGFEKSQHEASAKHQGNLKRFLRDIHRDNERQQRESDKAKHEVSRLRQTVAGGSSSAARDHGPRAVVPEPKPAQRPASLEERKKQIAQLADMGIAVPEEFRRDMALAGEWQTVSQKVVRSEDAEVAGKTGASVGVRKRKHEGDEEEEDAEIKTSVSKPWGSRFRDYPVAETQDEGDLDALLDSAKDFKKVKPATSKGTTEQSPAEDAPVKRDEDAEEQEPSQTSETKDEKLSVDTAEARPAATETAEAAPGVVFKKRKAKAMKK